MKKVMILLVIILFSFAAAQMPKVNTDAVKSQAQGAAQAEADAAAAQAQAEAEKKASQAQQAAELAAAKELLKRAKPLPFKVNSYTLNLNDPNYQVQGMNLDKFMKEVLIPTLSEVINKLPEGSKVALIGHANQTGTEEASGDFIGNVELSKKRSEAVLDYLKKNSQLDSSRFAIVAKGSSSPAPGTGSKDRSNCRVSFDIQ